MRPVGALARSLELAGQDLLLRVSTPAERARLSSALPAFAANAAALAALPLPLVLEHGDLWPSNVLIDGLEIRIIDWEDACIGHPFVGLAPLYVGLSAHPCGTPDALARVERAYAQEFRGYVGDGATEALRLARPLAFVDMALRYGHQRASMASQHPWMRDVVPDALRRAVALL
jgi:aminoglycoside phosphotransferase (APT) family kinase protein